MRKMNTASLCLLMVCLFAAVRGQADVTGYASIDYDPASNQVIAYCETDTDFDAEQYYHPITDCFINDANGSSVANGHDEDYSGFGYASVTIQADAQADEQYIGENDTSVELYYFYNGGWFYDAEDMLYWPYQAIYAQCCFDFYPGPYGAQQAPNEQIQTGIVYDRVTPPRPTMLKIRQWCRTGFVGNDLPYWLMDSSGSGQTRQTWDIIEHQTDTSLTPSPHPYGAGTSYQNGQVFDDAIGGLSGHHDSYQNFTIGTGPGKPQYPVTIIWFGGTNKSRNHLVIDGSTVVIDGDSGPAQDSCRNNY